MRTRIGFFFCFSFFQLSRTNNLILKNGRSHLKTIKIEEKKINLLAAHWMQAFESTGSQCTNRESQWNNQQKKNAQIFTIDFKLNGADVLFHMIVHWTDMIYAYIQIYLWIQNITCNFNEHQSNLWLTMKTTQLKRNRALEIESFTHHYVWVINLTNHSCYHHVCLCVCVFFLFSSLACLFTTQ